MRIAIFILTYFWSAIGIAQEQILPDNSLIRYSGRFSFENPLVPTVSFNGTSVEWSFEGTGTSISLSTATKTAYLYVIIDGNADVYNRQIIEVNNSSPQDFILAENLNDGIHTIKLVKLSEYDSKIRFHSISTTGGGLIQLPDRKKLKLEFYGDSNAAGWSAWDAKDAGGAEASEAFFSYPGLVANMLNAEYSLIGVSGSGITNRTWLNLADKYDLIHVTEPETNANKWDFGNNYWNYKPDAVIINLGANDYYGSAPKPIIKQEWKDFVKKKLRLHYPEAHIVFANSYGWAINEPADYVNEAVEELKNSGDSNISFVKFPWLWGQEHAVINEHAGFANILAKHLSNVLNIPVQNYSELSSIRNDGQLYNGSFEKSILDNVADGWRPRGETNLLDDENAVEGSKVIQLINGGRVHSAIEAEQGMELTFSIHGRGLSDLSDGFVKIEFKDQGQNTLKTSQVRPDFTTAWQSIEVSGIAPAGTWSAWLILESSPNSEIFFDQGNIQVIEKQGSIEIPLKVYPNPFDNNLQIEGGTGNYALNVYTSTGKLFRSYANPSMIDTTEWKQGMYIITIPELEFTEQYIKHP